MRKKIKAREVSINVSDNVVKQIEQKTMTSSSAIWFVETQSEDSNI